MFVHQVIRTTSSVFIIIIFFFYEKILSAQKTHHKQKTNQQNKIKQTKGNKGNNFSRAQKLLRGWKLFVLRFGAFFYAQNIFVKKINKRTWNCPDNLIHYTTEVRLYEPPYRELFFLLISTNLAVTYFLSVRTYSHILICVHSFWWII